MTEGIGADLGGGLTFLEAAHLGLSRACVLAAGATVTVP